jgi:hypothetical protein
MMSFLSIEFKRIKLNQSIFKRGLNIIILPFFTNSPRSEIFKISSKKTKECQIIFKLKKYLVLNLENQQNQITFVPLLQSDIS